jgi:hypothetical protein
MSADHPTSVPTMPQNDANLMVPALRDRDPAIRECDRILHKPLDPRETKILRACEAVIEQGLAQFIEVGNALLTIKNQGLFRANYETFEQYLHHRWDLSIRRAYQLMGASQTVETIKRANKSTNQQSSTEPMVQPSNGYLPLPANERQARALSSLPPSDQPKAWQQAVATARGGQPSAREVATIVQEIKHPGSAPITPSRKSRLYVDIAYPITAARELWEAMTPVERRSFAAEIRRLTKEPDPRPNRKAEPVSSRAKDRGFKISKASTTGRSV